MKDCRQNGRAPEIHNVIHEGLFKRIDSSAVYCHENGALDN
jgi:hypothetical protein